MTSEESFQDNQFASFPKPKDLQLFLFVPQDKQMMLGDKMDLGSYLLKPVQRMGKYALLIKQVLKECPTTVPEYHDLKMAEDMVRFQLRHGNDLLAMDALRDCDVSTFTKTNNIENYMLWQVEKEYHWYFST